MACPPQGAQEADREHATVEHSVKEKEVELEEKEVELEEKEAELEEKEAELGRREVGLGEREAELEEKEVELEEKEAELGRRKVGLGEKEAELGKEVELGRHSGTGGLQNKASFLEEQNKQLLEEVRSVCGLASMNWHVCALSLFCAVTIGSR